MPWEYTEPVRILHVSRCSFLIALRVSITALGVLVGRLLAGV